MLGDRCESKCLLPLPQEILFEISELLSSRFIWDVIELDAWRVAAGEEFPNIEIDTILGQIHNIWRWSLLATSSCWNCLLVRVNYYYLESISIETSCLHLRLGKRALLVDAFTQYIVSIQYRWQNWGTLEGAHLSAPSPQWPVSPLSPLASVPSPALVTEQTGSEIGW